MSPDSRPEFPKDEKAEAFVKKFTNIPTLSTYNTEPDEQFWDNFPKRGLPMKPETVINIENLQIAIEEAKSKLSRTELRRAEREVTDLTLGASAYQIKELPACITPNAKSAFVHGELLTDKLASWIEKGFVSGPFSCAPMPGFRANPLIAVFRNNKVRPVLNMSGPKGKSFNDNIDKRSLEKVHMSTAKSFGKALLRAGKDAKFSKFDIVEAYKLIPAKPQDIRLQGFTWLGKSFCESQGTFGGIGSVCNFDRLGNTKDLLVCIRSNTPRDTVLRALDDSPNVAPANSGIAERFAKEMRSFCEFINLPLAENSADNDKAFELQTRGIVLGIGFDSTSMTWFLPNAKADKVIKRCLDAVNSSHLDLKQTQKLMGSVNDLAQMCPTLKFHKGSGNQFLSKFKGNENILLQVPKEMKADMLTAAKIADTARIGLPIADVSVAPPLSALTFYTDAAGASYNIQNGRKVFPDQQDRGVACVAGESVDKIWAWSRLTWPKSLLTELKDERGKLFGCKSTTLESIGLLIPFIAFPSMVKGAHLVFKVDNIAVYYGWHSGYVKFDSTATEVLRAVHYLSASMGASVYVDHVPRVSNEMAKLADELSRRPSPADPCLKRFIRRDNFFPITGPLIGYLKNPLTNNIVKLLIEESM